MYSCRKMLMPSIIWHICVKIYLDPTVDSVSLQDLQRFCFVTLWLNCFVPKIVEHCDFKHLFIMVSPSLFLFLPLSPFSGVLMGWSVLDWCQEAGRNMFPLHQEELHWEDTRPVRKCRPPLCYPTEETKRRKEKNQMFHCVQLLLHRVLPADQTHQETEERTVNLLQKQIRRGPLMWWEWETRMSLSNYWDTFLYWRGCWLRHFQPSLVSSRSFISAACLWGHRWWRLVWQCAVCKR